MAYRGFVFRISRTDAAPRTFYLRLRTDHSSILFPRLWAPGEFLAAKSFVYGILFGNLGLLLALLLVNVGAWLWFRERDHVLLVAYLVGMIAALLGNEGFIAQYLLPSHPVFADALVTVATHASVSLGSRFYQHVLLPESRRGALHVLFQLGFWLPIAALGAVALGFPVEAAQMSSAVVLGMTVVIVPLSFLQWRRGAAGGGFLFAATLIFAAGLVGTTLQFLGVLSSRYALLHSMNVTALAGALTLQAGIVARVLALRRDRRHALEAAREAEELSLIHI